MVITPLTVQIGHMFIWTFFNHKNPENLIYFCSQLTIPYQNKCSKYVLNNGEYVATIACQLALRVTKPLISEYLGIKWQGDENDSLPTASTEVKNVRKRTSTPSYVFTARCFINHWGNSTFLNRHKISPLYIALLISSFLESLELITCNNSRQSWHGVKFGENKTGTRAVRRHAVPAVTVQAITMIHLLSTQSIVSIAVFFNRRAAARYRTLASIIPGRQRFSWNW